MACLATIAPFGFADFNPPTFLRLCREMGCQHAQFYRNPAATVDPALARRIAEDAGTPFDSIHGLFGPELDPSSPDPALRQRAIDTYRAEADLALALGGAWVVVHPAPMARGAAPTDPAALEACAAALQRTMHDLAAIGTRTGIVFLLENLPGNYLAGADAAALAQGIRQFNHANIRMCFDTGHAHMTGDAAHSLAACRDVVAYVHVHDNNGRLDAHQIPGQGSCPFPRLGPVIAQMPRHTPVMLELFESEASLRKCLDTGLPERWAQWLAIGGGV